tara:strand:+ start:121 stop:405 length:285 start_codon:yes stop_codon:yes gene_type:complete
MTKQLTTDEQIQAHWDAHHAKYRDEAMDEKAGLFTNGDARWLFINKVCELIGGEDAHKRFTPNELIKMCEEMSESHRVRIEELEKNCLAKWEVK